MGMRKLNQASARRSRHRPHARAAGWRGWLNQAIRAHQQGDLDRAARLYRKVLGCELAQPDALHFLGVLRHQRGDSDEAVKLIAAALAVVPGHADAHNNLGNIHKECGRLPEAEACYRRALECAPGHHNAHANLAVVLEAQGRLEEAFAAYNAVLERAPDYAHGYRGLGRFLMEHPQRIEHIEQSVACFRRAYALDDSQTGVLSQLAMALYTLQRTDEARDVYRTWLDREPDNPIPRHMLAASGGAVQPARADDDYVRNTFDQFAASFDAQLLGHLHYRAPEVLAHALADVLPQPPAATLDILDAGCGTGLCAPLLRGHAKRLTGVDLSAGMLQQARQRGVYDDLAEAELTAWLGQHPGAYDAVLSADTLVYFGDLAAVLAGMRLALRPGGRLVFSLEAMTGAGYALSPSGRYRHSRRYVEDSLVQAGFADPVIRADSLRREAGQPVASWVVLAVRNAHTDSRKVHLATPPTGSQKP